ncbi:MAG: TIM barrel protein [Tissierellia bacterium]|nr:TIM barrel protein [Tissierellia bacterium]
MFKKSILVSNILDPLTHEKTDLEQVYKKLYDLNRYESIETRLIEDDELRQSFNKIAKKRKWKTLFWITGVMSREGFNLSSCDETFRKKSVERVYTLMDQANHHICSYVGIASGIIEKENNLNKQINRFSKSIYEIVEYIENKQYSFNLVIEPLDQFAHKKNVLGSLDSWKKLMLNICNISWLKNGRLSFCWDSAHVALNEDDFIETLKVMLPYLSHIHFSDAILNKNSNQYGDYHREFDDKGIINLYTAKNIVHYLKKIKIKDRFLFVAVEVRTKNREDSWRNEEKYYNFLNKIIE